MKVLLILSLVMTSMLSVSAYAKCNYQVVYTIADAGDPQMNINPGWVSSAEKVSFLKNSECNKFSQAVKDGKVTAKRDGGNKCTLQVSGYARSNKIVKGTDLMKDKKAGARIPECANVRRFGVRFK
jgi:hypothetical protein